MAVQLKPTPLVTERLDWIREKQALAELERNLPYNDGEPMENERERLQINLLLDVLDHHWRDRHDFYTGGNMFLFYSVQQAQKVIEELGVPAINKTAFRGPDVFVVLDVDGVPRRQRWVVWQEGGRYPNVIVELLSPSTRRADLGTKKDLYERTFCTQEYFCFDPFEPDLLIGWRLVGRHYRPIEPNEQGWLWSEELQLWLGHWEGTYKRDHTIWLRFYDADGNLALYSALFSHFPLPPAGIEYAWVYSTCQPHSRDNAQTSQ